VGTAPKIGQTFFGTIALTNSTVSTTVAFSAAQSAPWSDPAITGEILLQGPLLWVDAGISLGLHSLPIPFHPALVGLTLHSQGFRKEVSTTEALNGIALTIGV
jgi:hypothetical protein